MDLTEKQTMYETSNFESYKNLSKDHTNTLFPASSKLTPYTITHKQGVGRWGGRREGVQGLYATEF